MQQENGEKAVRCPRHVEARDFEGVRAMCTRVVIVWHNDGKGEQTIDEKLEQLDEPLVPAVDSLRYEAMRQFETADEVLRQHVLNMAMPDGSHSAVHAAMYFGFQNGLIDRMEEYAYPVPADNGKTDRG